MLHDIRPKRYDLESFEVMREIYLHGAGPWIVGYSGGKDSTATMTLVWAVLESLHTSQRTREVYVVCTDTRVENPVVSAWAAENVDAINAAAARDGLPIHATMLAPDVERSYWVYVIGKGYPTPRRTFRWCTERLKIEPNKAFIAKLGTHEPITLVLGTRRGESTARGARMDAAAATRTRRFLSPSTSQPGVMVLSPIEEWSSDEVWRFLLHNRWQQMATSPWGITNHRLKGIYAAGSEDNECPIVVDTSAPSCGSSRFGCWVCTLVTEDRSMAAMVRNDDEHEWMLPLLDFRDRRLSVERDPVTRAALDDDIRELTRSNGRPTLVSSGKPRLTRGRYVKTHRETLLRELLMVQKEVQKRRQGIEVITLAELRAIRDIWRIEHHEYDDLVPVIYEDVMGTEYPDERISLGFPDDDEAWQMLREECGDDVQLFAGAMAGLGLVHDMRTSLRRHGHMERLEEAMRPRIYRNHEDALDHAQRASGQADRDD